MVCFGRIFFDAGDGIRDLVWSRGHRAVYKMQGHCVGWCGCMPDHCCESRCVDACCVCSVHMGVCVCHVCGVCMWGRVCAFDVADALARAYIPRTLPTI